jgi:hypothetical protein
MVNIKTNKRLLFCYFILAICFFGLIFTFYKKSVNFDSNAEGFVTLPQPVTYSKELIQKWADWNDPNFNKPTTDIQKDYGKYGVSEKDINDYMYNQKWNWSDQFTQDFKKINSLSLGKPIDIEQLNNTKKYTPQNVIIYAYAEFAKMEGAWLNQFGEFKSLKCDIDASGNSNGPGMMYIDSSGNKTFKFAKNEDLPTILPGFGFIKGPCNPCNIFNKKYDCPFIAPANIAGVYPPAPIQYMWGVGEFEDKQSQQPGFGIGGDAPASKSEDKDKPWSIF